jgi:molecular chaperone DnaK (HSP70)
MKKCLEDIGQKQFDKKLQCNIRLKRACEIAKIKLSSCDSTKIILEEYSKDIPINFPLTKKISKNFVNLCLTNSKIY